MSLPNWLDSAVLVAMLAAAVVGWRRGAIVALLGFAGAVTGAGLTAALAATLLAHLAPGSLRLLLALLLFTGCVAAGVTVGHRLGRTARAAVRTPTARRTDAAAGSFAHAVAVPLVVWLFVAPFASSATAQESALVHSMDEAAPPWLTGLSTALTAPLIDAGLARPLAPPDPRLAAGPAPAALAESVVRVHDLTSACRTRQSGSGFVIAAQRVLTNAHVVAGATEVSVDAATGPLRAVVVHFDPALDVAVLAVPDLMAPTIPVAPAAAEPGADALALGYPQGGPYTATETRVRGIAVRQVRDIYRTGLGERRIYTLTGAIRHGNSGGPLIDARGRALGVVFGVDEKDADTGFATSLPDVLGSLGNDWRSGRQVDTGPCLT